MIAILDNGERHSGHAILFLDLGDVDPERVLPLVLKKIEYDVDRKPSVLGLAASIDWRDTSAVEPLFFYWINIGSHEADAVWNGETFAGWSPSSCPAYVARQEEAEAALTEETKDAIWARPWDPEGVPCTCIAGEIYRAAKGEKA